MLTGRQVGVVLLQQEQSHNPTTTGTNQSLVSPFFASGPKWPQAEPLFACSAVLLDACWVVPVLCSLAQIVPMFNALV